MLAVAVAAVGSAIACSLAHESDRTVTVEIVVAGPGEVRVDGLEICASTCSFALDRGTELRLEAHPLHAAAFDGWRGGCAGRDAGCRLRLEDDASIEALFAGCDQPDWFLTRADGALRAVADDLCSVVVSGESDTDEAIVIGDHVSESPAGEAAFVGRYLPSAELVRWLTLISGPSTTLRVRAVAHPGDLTILSGYMRDGSELLVATERYASLSDQAVWHVTLDRDGNPMASHLVGASETVWPGLTALTSDGSIVTNYCYKGTLLVGGETFVSNGSRHFDEVIVKLDADTLEPAWAVPLTDDGFTALSSITSLPTGIVLTGVVEGNARIGEVNLWGSGTRVFLAALNGSGEVTFTWQAPFEWPGTRLPVATGISTGEVVVLIPFSDEVDLGTGSLEASPDAVDLLWATLSVEGRVTMADRLGTAPMWSGGQLGIVSSPEGESALAWVNLSATEELVWAGVHVEGAARDRAVLAELRPAAGVADVTVVEIDGDLRLTNVQPLPADGMLMSGSFSGTFRHGGSVVGESDTPLGFAWRYSSPP